jgi:hypothetical protein
MHVKRISGEKNDLYLLNATTSDGRQAWYYLKIDKLKFPIFKFKTAAKNNNINLTDFGKIIASGWGDEPPASKKAEIEGGKVDNAQISSDSAINDFVIYYLTASSMDDQPVYYYVAVSLNKISEFEEKMKAEEFNVRKSSVILLSGYGLPTEEEKELMEREYGFDHSRINDPNAPLPIYSLSDA